LRPNDVEPEANEEDVGEDVHHKSWI
jgi:hypothetical protein